jgi:RNase P subunit RPR2
VKTNLSKTEAKEKIDKFFERTSFTSEEMRKIKRLAMKFRIRLKEKRKRFCKKCLSQLKGKLRISKEYKVIECEKCGFRNRFKIN